MTSEYKKKIKPGVIELDSEESTILVHYQTQTINPNIIDPQTQKPTVIESINDVKKIKLKSFTPHSTTSKFADIILQQCNYIHTSKYEYVCGLLEQLKVRLNQSQSIEQYSPIEKKEPIVDPIIHTSAAVPVAQPLAQHEYTRPGTSHGRPSTSTSIQPPVTSQPHPAITAPISNAVPVKSVVGAMNSSHTPNEEQIKQISKSVNKLIKTELKQQQILIQTRKPKLKHLNQLIEQLYDESVDVRVESTYQLLYLLHGDTIDLATQANTFIDSDANILMSYVQHNTLLNALSRILTEDKRKSTKLAIHILCIFNVMVQYNQLFYIVTDNKIGLECMKIIDLQLSSYATLTQSTPDTDTAVQIYQCQTLLLYSIRLLWYMSDDLTIEYKIRNRNIVSQLCSTIQQHNPYHTGIDAQLKVCVVQYLIKLSVISDNITQMIESHVIQRIITILKQPSTDATLTDLCVTLLFNLSYTAKLSSHLYLHMNYLIELFNTCSDTIRTQVVKLFYNMTTHNIEQFLKLISLDSIQQITGQLIPLVLQCSNKHVDSELTGLLINLSQSNNVVNQIINTQPDLITLIFKRVYTAQDTLLCKWLRVLCENSFNTNQSGAVQRMRRHIHELYTLYGKLYHTNGMIDTDFVYELTGLISLLHYNDVPYAELCKSNKIIDILCNVLQSADDDLILFNVQHISVLLTDQKTASLMYNTPIINTIGQLLYDKYNDTDLCIQLLHCVNRLCLYDNTRSTICRAQQLIDLLYEYSTDSCSAISYQANSCIDQLALSGEETIRDTILTKRFQYSHSQWLTYIEQQGDYNSSQLLNDSASIDVY